MAGIEDLLNPLNDDPMYGPRRGGMAPGQAEMNQFMQAPMGVGGAGRLLAGTVGGKFALDAGEEAYRSAQFADMAMRGEITPYIHDPELGTIPNPAYTEGTAGLALNLAAPSFSSAVLRSAAGKNVVDPNRLGIFASTGAATADRAKLAIAEDMLAKGANRDEIWDATGWFKGRDGKWRFEIQDTDAQIKRLPEAGDNLTLKDVYDHPEFYKAYPEAADIPVTQISDFVRDAYGGSPFAAHRVEGGKDIIGITRGFDDPRSGITHEVQHFVQNKEGMASGGSPNAPTPYGEKKFKEFLPTKSENVSEDELRSRINKRVYLMTHGEVEPRNVEARMELGYGKRPWETLDVPEDYIIYNNRDALEEGVKGYNQGGLVSRMPMDRYLNALGTIESGNNYSALGPRTESGNQAYGRYQVMDFNIPVWTKEVLGQSLTPQQFLENRQAQDAVAAAKFGQYVEQYGNPYDAASMWFSGRPMQQAGQASDVTGTSVPQYVGRFANALGMPMPEDAEGIAAIDRELLELRKEREAQESKTMSNAERRKMISALTDYYESTLPKQADFSMLKPMGRRG